MRIVSTYKLKLRILSARNIVNFKTMKIMRYTICIIVYVCIKVCISRMYILRSQNERILTIVIYSLFFHKFLIQTMILSAWIKLIRNLLHLICFVWKTKFWHQISGKFFTTPDGLVLVVFITDELDCGDNDCITGNLLSSLEIELFVALLVIWEMNVQKCVWIHLHLYFKNAFYTMRLEWKVFTQMSGSQ